MTTEQAEKPKTEGHEAGQDAGQKVREGARPNPETRAAQEAPGVFARRRKVAEASEYLWTVLSANIPKGANLDKIMNDLQKLSMSAQKNVI